MLLQRAAYAAEVSGADVTITTPDGTVDAYFVHPASGKAPGVIMWPDIFGLRPAFREMPIGSPRRATPCWCPTRSTATSREPW